MTVLQTIFVGLRVEMSSELRIGLAQVGEELRGGCCPRLVKPENYHLTLAFLGKSARDAALRDFGGCADQVGEIDPFDLVFRGIGAFGQRRHPARVIFAEPAAHPTLDLLGTAFRKLADRDPVFHLTIARTREAKDGRWAHQNILGDRALGSGRISAVSLMANDGSGLYIDLAQRDFVSHGGR